MSDSYNLTVEMRCVFCFECGIQFALPAKLWNANRRYAEPTFCPNGHENFWKSEADAAAEAKEEQDLQACRAELTAAKGALVELRHRAEQAEARAGGTPQHPSDEVPDPPDARPVIRQDADGRYLCPHCNDPYKTWAPLRNHVRRHHQDHDLATIMYDKDKVRIATTTRPQQQGGSNASIPG